MTATRKAALIELRDKVKAGFVGLDLPRSLIWAAFGRDMRPGGEPIWRVMDYILDPDDMRAMGAAKALHEAVLPRWTYCDHLRRGLRYTTYISKSIEDQNFDGCSNCPARALLLADLEALIAEEGKQ